MNRIEAAIFNRLKELVGAPVYLREAPQEEDAACVVFGVSLSSDVTGTAPLWAGTIAASCYSSVYADAGALASQLMVGMEGWRYGAAGLRIGPCMRVASDASYESDWQLYRSTLNWAAQIVEWGA